MRVVGILLAAGRGTRFGGHKLEAPLPQASHGVPAGAPLGVAAALHLVAASTDAVAVVRPGDRLIGPLRGAGLRIVECTNADDGMGASLACGVAATHGAGGWIVALADMPWIAPATIRAVANAMREGADIVAPVHRGERGHPVGFAARHRDALCALTGDAGARWLLARHAGAVTLLDVDDSGVVRDVDTRAALAPGEG
ncbi:MAG TPA: nucleotidyltransferase family protein [Casimicrobiaceae bacterium]|nr:nucleotidyltransferase family protein [Casimicrobiaceae bacterium]